MADHGPTAADPPAVAAQPPDAAVRSALAALGRRLGAHRAWAADLADRLGAVATTEPVTELLEDLSNALEELAVASEELQVQGEELFETKHALDEQRARYADLFDRAPDAYLVTDTTGMVREANQAALDLLDPERRRGLVGKPLVLYLAAPHRARFHRLLALADPHGVGQGLDLTFVSRDGRVFPGAVRLARRQTASGPELRWTVRDATEGRRRQERDRMVARCAAAAAGAEDVHSAVAALHRVLLAIAPHDWLGLCLIDDLGLRVGAAAGAAAGAAPVGTACDLSEGERSRLEAADGLIVSSPGRADPPPGVPPGLAAGAWLPFRSGGRVAGLLVLYARPAGVFDAVDRELLEAGAGAATAGLVTLAALDTERRTSAALRELEQMRADVLDLVVHEVRAPLAAIRTWAEALQASWEAFSDQRRLAALARIEQSAARLARLVTRVLEAGWLEAGGLRSECAAVPLGAVVAAVLPDLEVLDPGQQIAVDVPADLMVLADDSLLVEALMNLLTNAVRFSPPGHPVEVTARRDGEEAVVSVRDHGPGVDPAVRARLFERHGRPATPRAGRAAGGYGLGLYLARRLMESQGGSIEADNPPGGGARFSLRLPLAPAEPEPPGRRG